MQIGFIHKKLQNICCESKTAHKELGTKRAKHLQVRLAELRAAARLGELVNGRPHPLVGDRAHQFSLDLDGPMRLLLEVDGAAPKLSSGATDWQNVTAVLVVEIEDTHD